MEEEIIIIPRNSTQDILYQTSDKSIKIRLEGEAIPPEPTPVIPENVIPLRWETTPTGHLEANVTYNIYANDELGQKILQITSPTNFTENLYSYYCYGGDSWTGPFTNQTGELTVTPNGYFGNANKYLLIYAKNDNTSPIYFAGLKCWSDDIRGTFSDIPLPTTESGYTLTVYGKHSNYMFNINMLTNNASGTTYDTPSIQIITYPRTIDIDTQISDIKWYGLFNPIVNLSPKSLQKSSSN